MSKNGFLRPLLILSVGSLVLGAACTGSGAGDGTDRERDAPASRATATATPASTVSADPDADRAATDAYIREVEALLDDLALAATAVAEVMEEADFDSAAWRAEASTVLDAFGELHQQAEQLEAERNVEHLQQRLLLATEGYWHAAALLQDSLDELDLDGIDEASLALGDAILAAAEVRALLRAVIEG